MNYNNIYGKMSKEGFILSFLILIAVILRLNGINSGFWFDETISANLANSVLENGYPQNAAGDVIWRAFPHIYLMAFSGYILGSSEFSFRIVSVFFSVLTIILTYLFAKDIFNKEVAYTSALLLTFSSWHIAWGQEARMYAMFQFFYLLSIYSIYKFSNNINYKNLVIMSSAILLAFTTHITGYILPLLLLLYLLLFNTDNLGLKKYFLAVLSLLFTILSWSKLNIGERLEYSRSSISFHLETVASQSPDLIFLTGLASTLFLSLRNKKIVTLFILAIIPANVIYVGFYPRASSRLSFFVLPFLVIMVSASANNLFEKLDFKNIFYLKIIFIVILSGSLFFMAPSDPRLNIEASDFKSSYAYVEDNYSEGDRLITYLSTPATYYFRTPDKTLLHDFPDENYIVNGKDRYSGTEALIIEEDLERLIEEEESVWLIIGHRELNRYWQNKVTEKVGPPVYKSKNIKVWYL